MRYSLDECMDFWSTSICDSFCDYGPTRVVPIFLGLVSPFTEKERRKLAVKTAIVSFTVIITFALFGQFILGYLKISLPAMQGAGGLLLLLVALELLTGKNEKKVMNPDLLM